MSAVTGIPQDHPDRLLKKSFHRRNDSGELDVFEAARYFSGYTESANSGGFTSSSFTHHHHIMTKEDNNNKMGTTRSGFMRVGARISLDMPIRHVLSPHDHQTLVNTIDHNNNINNKQTKEDNNKKLFKQPSSPGGRLASFLNSLFSQSALKNSNKKKSKPSSVKDVHELEEGPAAANGGGGGRRKRRSSISHFRRSSTAGDHSNKSSFYNNSGASSGFRTPPAYAQTPTKSYKDFKEFANKQNHNNNNNSGSSSSTTTSSSATTTSTNNGTHAHVVKPSATTRNDHQEYHVVEECMREAQKERKSLLGDFNSAILSSEKDKRSLGLMRRFDDHDEEKERYDGDDGAESDSSSDLFELQNYDLGCYSSGLPVYETTNMDSIKRGAPISNASM